MKSNERLKYIRALYHSTYCSQHAGEYQYSKKLVKFLARNPELASETCEIFLLRDEFMKPQNFEPRWEMGGFLIQNCNIEFEQSEGSELIFSLSLAIKKKLQLSYKELGTYFMECIDDIR